MLSANRIFREMQPMPWSGRSDSDCPSAGVSYSSTRLGIIFRNFSRWPAASLSRIQRQSADSECTGHHPLAGEHLEDFQNLFALAKTVKKYRHCARDRSRESPARPDAKKSVAAPPSSRGCIALVLESPAPEVFRPPGNTPNYSQRIQVIHPSVSVIACEYVLSSQDFSMPVCRYPRSGIAFTTFSPSSSSRIRKHTVRRRVLRPHVEDHGFCCAGGGINSGHGVELFLKSSPVFGTSRYPSTG